MLRMESHHSDSSLNFPERESPAWVRLWNANYNSSGGLNLGENGSDTDLTSAIGDKEVAAKAVAFVVNSTRKGIVPLCADVANLLRNKRSLEDKIVQLSKENEALRQIGDERESLTGSTVTHNTKPSEPSDPQLNGRRSNSICSFHSSTQASPNSTINDDSQNRLSSEQTVQDESEPSDVIDSGGGVTAKSPTPCSDNDGVEPPDHSFVPVTPAVSASPRADNEVIVHPIPANEESLVNKRSSVAKANVHKDSGGRDSENVDRHKSARQRRTPSLSSSEHGSNRSLELNTNSEGWQSVLSDQLSRTVKANQKLTEELNAARATIEKLQREVRDFRVFCKNNNHDTSDNNWHAAPLRQNSAPEVLPPQAPNSITHSRDLPLRAAILPSCQVCAEVQTSAINGAIPRIFKHDSLTLFTSENTLVNLEDSVLTCSNQCGTVRYIGHLDGFAPTCLFVGLQLPEKVHGGVDGSFNGKKYFSCPKGRGIFVQAQDIVNIITKKQAAVLNKSKKSASSLIQEESPASSSSSGSAAGLVSKLRKAVNLRHTNSHKRISLPGSTNNGSNNQSNNVSSSHVSGVELRALTTNSSTTTTTASAQSNIDLNAANTSTTTQLSPTTTTADVHINNNKRNSHSGSEAGLPEGFV